MTLLLYLLGLGLVPFPVYGWALEFAWTIESKESNRREKKSPCQGYGVKPGYKDHNYHYIDSRLNNISMNTYGECSKSGLIGQVSI
jgi:hypothetical protein